MMKIHIGDIDSRQYDLFLLYWSTHAFIQG
jgi:hypothetical protein